MEDELKMAVFNEYRRLNDNENTSAKDWRQFHKYGKYFGYRMPLYLRYPNFPLVISIISLLLVLLKPILTGMHQ